MKRLVFVVAVLLVCSGCIADRPFFDAQEANWRYFGPILRTYVEKDAALTPEQREARLGTAALQDAVLAAHRKVVYGE